MDSKILSQIHDLRFSPNYFSPHDRYLVADSIEELIEERNMIAQALSNMRFAYLNKDDPPHMFETEALKMADEIVPRKENPYERSN